ncbi:MAG: hypothetical protein AB1645_08055 [Bacillota bacterium]
MAECEWMHVCDYAMRDHVGKLSLIGLFDTLGAGSVPVTHSKCFLAFRLKGVPGEEVPIEVKLVGPDGKIVWTAANPQSKIGPRGKAEHIFELQGMPFPEFGRYEFQLWVGGTVMAWTPLDVKQMTRPQAC